MKKFFKKHRIKILITLFLLSIIEFIYTLLFLEVSETVKETLPVAFIVTIISEILFIVGIGIMGYTIEHELGLNPLKWRKHLKTVMKKVPENRLFWIGFWLNAVGALMTGVVWLIVVIRGLPIEAWGILWLPVSDIILTLGLRASIIELRREKIIG